MGGELTGIGENLKPDHLKSVNMEANVNWNLLKIKLWITSKKKPSKFQMILLEQLKIWRFGQ